MADCFNYLYWKQIAFQSKVLNLLKENNKIPRDDEKWSSYHILGLTEEVGELLKADKRWKTHRNINFDPENKLTEIADVIICALNVAIFSGFTIFELNEAISKKIDKNLSNLEGE